MRPFNPKAHYWKIAGDGSKMWSSLDSDYVALSNSNYQAFLAADCLPTSIASMDELIEVLRQNNVPPYHSVPTIDIVRRLDAAGLLTTANAALESNVKLRASFYTVGAIYNDNAEARAFLTAVGADLDQILAPIT